MTSTTMRTATWLPAAMLRAAVMPSSQATPAPGRHRAPESGAVEQVLGEEAPPRPGRHAEPEEDSLDWLGFALRRD